MLTPIVVTGIGVHTGLAADVIIRPGPPGTGAVFEVDREWIPARLDRLFPDAHRRTVLEKNGRTVEMVEHLLATVALLDVPDLHITVTGPEVPILDGSAAIWLKRFIESGARPTCRFFSLRHPPDQPFRVCSKDAVAEIRPVTDDADAFIEVDIDLTAVGLLPMRHRFYPASDNFADLASARTFVFEQDIQALLNAGLAKGGRLDNAVVLGVDGCRNPEGLRFENEPARHKLLDLIGDLNLMGALPRAQIFMHRPGHAANHEVVRALASIDSRQDR